ncbi:sialidase family protein [Chloroflexota bacterium]
MFWVTWQGDDPTPPGEVGNAVLYRRWENGTWSAINDILAVRAPLKLVLEGVEVDDLDHLNLLWRSIGQGDATTLFLSQAHTSVADRAPAWTSQEVALPGQAVRIQAHLSLEAGGRIHLFYVRDLAFLEYTVSEDYGISWSRPVVISDKGAEIPKAAIDAKGYLHVTWTYSDLPQLRKGIASSPNREAVVYARSTDDGTTWDMQEIQARAPEESTVAFSNVIVRNGNEIHLAWNRGAGSQLGRYHAWSPDNGATWKEPQPILDDFVSGQTHRPRMVVDSARTLHLLTIGGRTYGPHYAYWKGATWSSMHSLSEGRIEDLGAAMALGLGNTLHVVYESTAHGNRLVYTALDTGAPAVPAERIPEPMADPVLATQAPTPHTVSERKETPTPQVLVFDQSAPGGMGSTDRWMSVGLPLIPVVLLLLGVIIWNVARRQ